MKKTFLFILALALLMLVAIPATAGPAVAPVTIETAMPSLLTAPAKASVGPNAVLVSFENVPPIFARISTISDLIASVSAIPPNYRYAFLAALAGLTCGVGLILANTSEHRLKYNLRDRMHGLPRDQTARA
jgi:hypothetical protein